jgi:hypothetical protein
MDGREPFSAWNNEEEIRNPQRHGDNVSYKGPSPGDKIEVEVMAVFKEKPRNEFSVVVEHPLLGRGSFTVKLKPLEEYDDTDPES